MSKIYFGDGRINFDDEKIIFDDGKINFDIENKFLWWENKFWEIGSVEVRT